MSTTTTSAAASCTGNIYVMPIQDAACAVPSKSNYTDVMDKCCKPASVTSYNDDCAYYCLAQEQSVGALTDCLTDNGVGYNDVWCNSANKSSTATASVSSATNTGTGTSSGQSASKTGGDDESAGVVLSQPVTKSGLGLLAVLVCSVAMGVVV